MAGAAPGRPRNKGLARLLAACTVHRLYGVKSKPHFFAVKVLLIQSETLRGRPRKSGADLALHPAIWRLANVPVLRISRGSVRPCLFVLVRALRSARATLLDIDHGQDRGPGHPQRVLLDVPEDERCFLSIYVQAGLPTMPLTWSRAIGRSRGPPAARDAYGP